MSKIFSGSGMAASRAWLLDRHSTDPWQALDDEEREALALMAARLLDVETLQTRHRDALDFKEVAVWTLREALARAYLAGSRLP